MTFAELKKYIDGAPNRSNYTLPVQFSSDEEDLICIKSCLYTFSIPCYNATSVDDIYTTVHGNELHPELFDNPYYIRVYMHSFSENTINIINSLGDSTFVEILFAYDGVLDDKKRQALFEISHKNCQFVVNGMIDLDTLIFLINNCNLEIDFATIAIKTLDDATIEKLASIYQNNPDLRSKIEIKVEIKEVETLQNLDVITPYIPEGKLWLVLSDDLFDENNPQNARYMIVQSKKYDKKMHIMFWGIMYDSLEQVYELQRNFELIKSHIPQNAQEIDIITYVSLFMINYFKYDYVMYENNHKTKDINLTQFISRGRGVCRHFAKFTKQILNLLGIKCEIIATSDHLLNIVEINGKSYFLDNTWLVERMQKGTVKSLSDSSDFLTSNANFGHDEYKDVLDDYSCEDYNRQEIKESVRRVKKWNSNYKISMQALVDLFRKHNKGQSVAEKIENAIPRRI